MRGDIGIVSTYDLLDARRGRQIRKLHAIVNVLARDPQQGHLALGGDRKRIEVFDGENGSVLHTLRGHTAAVTALAYGPHGTLLSGGQDGRLILWEPERELRRFVLTGSDGPVLRCGFSSHDQAWGATSRSIRRWRLAAPNEGVIVDLPGRWPYALRFDPTGEHLVVSGLMSQIRFHDGRTGRPLAQVRQVGGAERFLSFDGRETAFVRGSDFRRLDPLDSSRTLSIRVPAHQWAPASLDALASEPANLLLAAASNAGLTFIEFESGTRIATIDDKHYGSVPQGVVAIPNSHQLLVVTESGVLHWIDKETRRVLDRRHGAPSARCRALTFDSEGKLFARSLEDGSIELWDNRAKRLRFTLRGHTSFVPTLCFSPDGTRLASGSDDTQIRIWHVELGEPLLALVGHTQYVQEVRFHPEGEILASVSGDGTLRFWNTRPEATRVSLDRARCQRRRHWANELRRRLDGRVADESSQGGLTAIVAELEPGAKDTTDQELLRQAAWMVAHPLD